MDTFTMIWLLFIVMLVYLFWFMTRKIRAIKKMQQEAQIKYDQDKEKYKYLTSDSFDNVGVEELIHAVLFHIMGKEDCLYEGEEIDERELFDVLTEGERMIYTIYQLEISMDGGRGSIHSFFIEEQYAKYRPYVEKAFQVVDCFEIVELMGSAARLAEIIELDLDDEENDIEGDYENYNFADYTQKLLTLLKSSGIVTKAGKYIQANKEQFIDQDDRGEMNEERIECEV